MNGIIESDSRGPIRSLHPPMTHRFLSSSPPPPLESSQSLLHRLYPPARALHGALPATSSPTLLFRHRARRKECATRRVDVHERLWPRDVPAEEADGGVQRGAPSRARCSRASGRTTSNPPTSASTSIVRSPFVMPPSTLGCASSDLESSFMLSITACVWNGVCLDVCRWCKTSRRPVAPGSQYGASRPSSS